MSVALFASNGQNSHAGSCSSLNDKLSGRGSIIQFWENGVELENKIIDKSIQPYIHSMDSSKAGLLILMKLGSGKKKIVSKFHYWLLRNVYREGFSLVLSIFGFPNHTTDVLRSGLPEAHLPAS